MFHAGQCSGLSVEIASRTGADGKAHDKVFDVQPGSPTFGKELADLGRSKEDKLPSITQEIAKEKAGEAWVMGFDKNGVQKIMPKSQADEEKLTHVGAATPAIQQEVEKNTSAFNEIAAPIRSLITSSKALDQGAYQKTLIQTALRGHRDDMTTRGAVALMSQESKDYVQDVFSLREAALALPKVTTGGSRVTETQAEAMWNNVPGSAVDSKYAMRQLRKFDALLTRQWRKVPEMEGQVRERPFGEGGEGGGGGGGAAGGHNFFIGDKEYRGVPDEVYEKAKKKPGFRE